MKLFINSLLILSCLFVISSCSEKTSFPKKLSQLNSQVGIEVKKGVRCPDCCDVMFSEDFAYKNKEQFSFLLQMTKNTYIEEEDMDCPKPIMPLNYYALDRLLYLATNKQDKAAAKVILSPQRSTLLNLDGELAEEFTGDRILPVLEQYQDLAGILTDKHADSLAADLCYWKEFRGAVKRVNRIIKRLEDSGLKGVADVINKKCKNTKRGT